MPNLWRIVISCMKIWMVVTEGDMIRLDEFIHLYRLKESKEYRYYELEDEDYHKSSFVFSVSEV